MHAIVNPRLTRPYMVTALAVGCEVASATLDLLEQLSQRESWSVARRNGSVNLNQRILELLGY
jgi:hypothetical protein